MPSANKVGIIQSHFHFIGLRLIYIVPILSFLTYFILVELGRNSPPDLLATCCDAVES